MRGIIVCLIAAWLLLAAPACSKSALNLANNGLKPGLNYMQPLKWRMTYRYRVQEVIPANPIPSGHMSQFDPTTPAVGKGTWEVWFSGPREGEELRALKLISTSPKPTKVGTNKDGVTLYYYDMSPDGYLPQEMQVQLTWEFVTFERYAFWDGMQIGKYDTSSQFYKDLTKADPPIQIFGDLKKKVKKLIENDNGDIKAEALHCFNYVLDNFTYDDYQAFDSAITGSAATIDTFRCWQNKKGVCDEFATVLCSMLRAAGIPSRPVCGIVHQPITAEMVREIAGDEAAKNMRPTDVVLDGGYHAWTEMYLPDVGWVPLDATWGGESNKEPVVPMLSLMGATRGISYADYYFGKSDAYRIPWYKTFNIALAPPPKTPNAKKTEYAFICCTERSSGVKKIMYGYEGVEGLQTTQEMGWGRSAGDVGYNYDIELEALGPATASEVKALLPAIEKDGGHYLAMPALPGNWPFYTMGDAKMKPPEETPPQ